MGKCVIARLGKLRRAILLGNIEMKISTLVHDIILADADYFAKNGFTTPEECDRVKEWLHGKKDAEIQLRVADWLESDGEYLGKLGAALRRHHWFIWPLMWVMMKVVPRRLRKYAEELRKQNLNRRV